MIDLVLGDITTVQADAIVNAANSHLVPGGGVSGAIHRVGGSAIDEACAEYTAAHGMVKPGNAAVTIAGDLPAHFVIHAVGPVWLGGIANEADVLAETYRTSMRLADERGLRSITFPSISTGVFNYPADQAAPIAIETVLKTLPTMRALSEVTFVLFDQASLDLYSDALDALAGTQL